MTAKWLEGSVAAFDTETTGIDASTARIVTAAFVVLGRHGISRRRTWLINPGVDIPARATEIHGVTNEVAQRDGEAPLIAIPSIAAELHGAWSSGWPVIIMNAPYDLTLMQEELGRIGQETMTIGAVLDPLALDRCCEPFRKGKRTLDALCARYGAKQEGAHSADGDAVTAARVVWRQSQSNPDLDNMTLSELAAWQAWGHSAWAGEFESYLRRQGKPEAISREWPVRTC